MVILVCCVCNDTATTEIYTYRHTLSLHDALPISLLGQLHRDHPERDDISLALGRIVAAAAGESLYGDGNAKVARARALEARRLLGGLARPTPRSAGALAGAYLYLGDSYGWDNDLPKAGSIYEAGIKLVNSMQ